MLDLPIQDHEQDKDSHSHHIFHVVLEVLATVIR
jgi:hypothetical protein